MSTDTSCCNSVHNSLTITDKYKAVDYDFYIPIYIFMISFGWSSRHC